MLLRIGGVLVSTLVAGLGALTLRQRWIDKRAGCTIHGGRGGVIRCCDGSRVAEVEWEMLVGEYDMVVYESGIAWAEPERGPTHPDDAARLLRRIRAYLREMGIRHEDDRAPARRVETP